MSGPDHLAAVAPLALGVERPWRIGLRWGLGHSSGVLLVGLLAFALRGLLPLETFSLWAERLVGVGLILIGLWGMRRALTRHLHAHEHTHEGQKHMHVHVHGLRDAHRDESGGIQQLHAHPHPHPHPHDHTHAAFAVGTLHGLAGSAHFVGVLPALAFPTWQQAGGFLLAYCVATVLVMAGFSSAVGWMGHGFEARGRRAFCWLGVACSTVAMAVGTFWLL